MIFTIANGVNEMLYYLVTSQNYKTFKSVEGRVKDIAYVEDITHLCNHEPHPWHIWLTNKVAKLIKVETFFAILLIVTAIIAAVITDVSTTMFVIGTIVVLLFSIWVCGLVGIEQVSHYMTCQSLLKDQEDTLAMYVETEEQNQENVECIFKEDESLNMYKVQI